MSIRRRSRLVGLAVALTVIATAVPAEAAITTIDGGAAGSVGAVPVELPFDAVSVFQTGPLTTGIRDRALAAARDAGAQAVVGRGFTALMTSVRRGATVVQKASGTGWAFPMAVTALPLATVGAVMGRDVSGIVAQGKIVMSQTSATIRGARVGDLVDLVGPANSRITFVIGRIGADAEVGGTEIVMTPEMANRLGATIPTRVLIFGQFDRAKVSRALTNRGLCASATSLRCVTTSALKAKVRRSWDPADPDGQMSMAETKSKLGEFDFYYAGLSTSGWTAMNARWVANYLPSRQTYPTGIRALCNRVVRADLAAALQEVVNSGLGGAIDAANANRYGGCATGSVRFARITQALGSVSRHSWGQPLDTNTTSNCQGCVPRMDCRVVRIFRKHGFVWGGNFLTPDGMHFEWVGEPRHTLPFDSKYCDNLPSGRIQVFAAPPATARDTLFADDGFLGDEHD